MQAVKQSKKNASTFEQQVQAHKEKYKSVMSIGQPKKQKLQKPQTESSMKGLIDLYKVINDTMITRV